MRGSEWRAPQELMDEMRGDAERDSSRVGSRTRQRSEGGKERWKEVRGRLMGERGGGGSSRSAAEAGLSLSVDGLS